MWGVVIWVKQRAYILPWALVGNFFYDCLIIVRNQSNRQTFMEQSDRFDELIRQRVGHKQTCRSAHQQPRMTSSPREEKGWNQAMQKGTWYSDGSTLKNRRHGPWQKVWTNKRCHHHDQHAANSVEEENRIPTELIPLPFWFSCRLSAFNDIRINRCCRHCRSHDFIQWSSQRLYPLISLLFILSRVSADGAFFICERSAITKMK